MLNYLRSSLFNRKFLIAIISFLILVVAFFIYGTTTDARVVVQPYLSFKGGYVCIKSPDRYEGLIYMPGIQFYFNTAGLSKLQLDWIKNRHKIPIEGYYWKYPKNKLRITEIF